MFKEYRTLSTLPMKPWKPHNVGLTRLAYGATATEPEKTEAFEAAEAASNEVFDAQFQYEMVNVLRFDLVADARMSTGDDPESLAYQRAWAALVAADESLAAVSAQLPNDLAIGDYFTPPPLVIPDGATDEETVAAEDAWRIETARLQQASDELWAAVYRSFWSGIYTGFRQSLQELC